MGRLSSCLASIETAQNYWNNFFYFTGNRGPSSCSLLSLTAVSSRCRSMGIRTMQINDTSPEYFPSIFSISGVSWVRDSYHVFSNPEWICHLLSERLLSDNPKQWCTHCLLFHCFFLQVVNFINLWQECYRGFLSWLGGKFLAEYSNLPVHYPIRKSHSFSYILFETKTLKVATSAHLKVSNLNPWIYIYLCRKASIFRFYAYCCFHKQVTYKTLFMKYHLYCLIFW